MSPGTGQALWHVWTAPQLLIPLLIIYLVPLMVAGVRRHRHFAAIAILNLFLGWTCMGWVGAFVWACL